MFASTHRHQTQLKRGQKAVHDPTPTQQGWATPSYQVQPQPEQALLLGRYRVVETRGTGGFGSVQVCWDTRLERRVAIKCMPLATAPGMSASTLSEALDEARITSRLTHPNIVTVHDFEVRGNVAYLIMEYVSGLTLAELLARVEGGVLTYDECAHLLSSLAAALDFAHANDVLHLDIKPSNVFIDSSGAVKLGDFGMASLASAAGWEGARGGTVGYMPPEQLAGELVDERTDVFALGVVCYQALTGISPFLAKDAEASRRKIERGAKPLAKVEPELAGPASDLIARATSADPSERPSTAGELAKLAVPYLGDEDEGHASVASLVSQATGEPDPNAQAWEEAAHVSPTERWPWLPAAVERTVAALAGAGIAWRVAPGIAAALGIQAAPTAASAACGAAIALLCALSPVAGGTAACALAVAGMLSGGMYSPAFLVAALAALALIGWRLATAESGSLAHAALLLPPATGSPFAGAGAAGAVLAPKAALVTGMAGAGLQAVLACALASGSGDAFAQGVVAKLAQPETWLAVLGCAVGAWLAALIGAGRGGARGIAGQVACAAILVGVQVLSARVENGGLWAAPDAAGIAVAVVCAVLVSIVISTIGPAPRHTEDE